MYCRSKHLQPVIHFQSAKLTLDQSCRLHRLGPYWNGTSVRPKVSHAIAITIIATFPKISWDDPLSTWQFEIQNYIWKKSESHPHHPIANLLILFVERLDNLSLPQLLSRFHEPQRCGSGSRLEVGRLGDLATWNRNLKIIRGSFQVWLKYVEIKSERIQPAK